MIIAFAGLVFVSLLLLNLGNLKLYDVSIWSVGYYFATPAAFAVAAFAALWLSRSARLVLASCIGAATCEASAAWWIASTI